MVKPIWERLKARNKYVYTQVNRNHQPIQFDSNTGTFRVYTYPNTSSHSFDTYIIPEQFKTNTINDSNPVQLKEVQITAKKPTEFVGIQRTPDDHQAALARDRAVDAKVNPQNDQLQSFFANLMTGGMYSAVDQGAKNIDKGNYLEGTAQVATPIMFGPAKSTVANLTRLGVGAYDLLSKNGVQKTYNLAKQGNWLGAAKSAAVDALNLGMTIGGGYNFGKEYNFSKYISPKTLYLSYKLNTKSPKYFYGFNDDKNLVNKFLGNNYFHQMHADKVQGTQLKGVDIKEPNQFRYFTPKAVEPTDNISLKFFERPNNLSFRERIGLSKGSYNDLDKYQKDALSDLEQFYTNGQYRNKFAYNPNTDKFEFTNSLSDGKTSGLKKIVDAGNYYVSDDYIRNSNGQLSYYYKLHNGSINLIPDGQTFGEMSTYPLTSYSKQIILTSPKVDMLDNNPDLVKEASKLPDKINKQSMKRFWDSVQQTTKPGTYLSGDNGVAPLGYKLIISYTDKNLSQATKDLLANNYDISSIVDRSGLSPDSYYSIVRQGLRPEHSLRFSRNGFTKLNPSAVDNKDLYQMWKSATTPEAKQQFISTWNKRIYPNSSFINNRGQIEFLHPFVYYKKFGGKLNNNGKN